MKTGFKKIINWNKYQSKVTTHTQSQYLDYSIDLGFQRINILFVLSFEDDARSHTRPFLTKVKIKDYNVMIDGRNLFGQPLKNDIRPYDNIQKIATGQGDHIQLVTY